MSSKFRTTAAFLVVLILGAVVLHGCNPVVLSPNGYYTVEGNEVKIVDAQGQEQIVQIDFNTGGDVNEPTINGYTIRYTRNGVESITKDGVEIPRR